MKLEKRNQGLFSFCLSLINSALFVPTQALVHRHELIDCFMLNDLHFFLRGVIYGYP
jgi:hypothetical protein